MGRPCWIGHGVVKIAELRGFVTAGKAARQIPAPDEPVQRGCWTVAGFRWPITGMADLPDPGAVQDCTQQRCRHYAAAEHVCRRRRALRGLGGSGIIGGPAGIGFPARGLDGILFGDHIDHGSLGGGVLGLGACAVGLPAGAGQFGPGGQCGQRRRAARRGCADRCHRPSGPSVRPAARSAPRPGSTTAPTYSSCRPRQWANRTRHRAWQRSPGNAATPPDQTRRPGRR